MSSRDHFPRISWKKGTVAEGRRRVRCRYTAKKGYYWENELSKCIGCEPVKSWALNLNL